MALACKLCGRRSCRGHTTVQRDDYEEAEVYARSNGVRVNKRDHTRPGKGNELSSKAAKAAWKWIKS